MQPKKLNQYVDGVINCNPDSARLLLKPVLAKLKDLGKEPAGELSPVSVDNPLPIQSFQVWFPQISKPEKFIDPEPLKEGASAVEKETHKRHMDAMEISRRNANRGAEFLQKAAGTLQKIVERSAVQTPPVANTDALPPPEATT